MSEPNSSSNSLRTFIRLFYIFLIIAQSGALGWLIYTDRNHARFQSNQQHQIEALTQSLSQVQVAIEQQTSVLDRTIGKIVPVQMPAQWSERLAALERVAASQDQWPQTVQAAQDYLNSTSELISELPPWAESEYMTRLNNVRWSAMVFTTINPPESGEITLHARAQTLAALSESVPDGVSTQLLEHVDLVQERLVEEADQADLESLLQRSAGYVADPTGVTSDIIQQDIVLIQAYSDSKDSRIRNEVKQRVKDLQKIVLRLEAEQQVQSLPPRIASLMQLKDKDSELVQTGIGMLFQEVRSTRIRLALFGIELESLDQIDSQLLTESEQLQIASSNDRAQAVRAYQQYALERINRFDKTFNHRKKIVKEAMQFIREGNHTPKGFADFPGVQDAIRNAKYTVTERKYWIDKKEYDLEEANEDIESYLTYLVCRDAMVTYLLPIDQNLLELPVNELFQETWQRGWKDLEGRDDQTFIAEQTVNVKKSTLADVKEGPQ